jgi:hypothetical protein
LRLRAYIISVLSAFVGNSKGLLKKPKSENSSPDPADLRDCDAWLSLKSCADFAAHLCLQLGEFASDIPPGKNISSPT